MIAPVFSRTAATMEYRSVAQLNDRIVDWVPRLPRDLDLIVGIPRSGLLASNLLALHMNLPMTDVEGLVEGRLLRSGSRTNGSTESNLLSRHCNVLVIDDSICSGSALAKVRDRISAANLPHRIHYAAVFVSKESEEREDADYFAEIVPVPRLFEWNVLHTPLLASMCVDIDGVLCHDPTPEENDDGPLYRRFLSGAAPLHLPSFEIGWLVTSRLEKYRAETEAWLDRHGVRYRELIMMQYPDMAARQAARQYSAFKANAYMETGASLFIESAPWTAAEVADATGKSVFCTQTREMLWPGDVAREPPAYGPVLHPAVAAANTALRRSSRILRKARRRLGV